MLDMQKNRKFDFALTWMSGGLILCGVAVRPITYLAFCLIAGVILLSKDKSIVFMLLFFVMPLATVFKISAGGTSFFTYIELFAAMCLLVRHFRAIDSRFFLAYMAYSSYVLIGCGNEITEAIKQVVFPLLIYFCLKKEYAWRVKDYAECYVVGVLLSSVCGYFRDFIPNMNLFVTLKSERLVLGGTASRFAGLWGDPNYYSINLVLAFILIMFFHVRREISTPRAIAFYVLMIAFGALSGSKMFVMMLAFIFVRLVIELYKKKRWGLGSLVTAVGVAGIGLILNGTFSIFDMVLTRLVASSGSFSALTTSRSDTWVRYYNYFLNHFIKLFVGNGIGQGYTLNPPHNTVIDYIDIYGILGSSIFIIMIVQTTRSSKKAKEMINHLPLLSIIAMYMALSMLFYVDTAFQIMLALLILYYDDNAEQLHQKDIVAQIEQ